MARNGEDRVIRALREQSEREGRRVEGPHPVADGLRVRVNAATDAVTFIWYGPRDSRGKRKLEVLGNYPAVSVKEAAEKLHELRERLTRERQRRKAGLPVAPPRAERFAHMTLTGLVARFTLRVLRHKRVRPKDAAWVLRKYVLEDDLLDPHAEVRTLRPEDFHDLIQRLVDKGIASTAGKVRDLLVQMFDFALGQHILDRTWRVEDIGTREGHNIVDEPSGVMLSTDGLAKLWRALHEGSDHLRGGAANRETIRLAFIILLSTARRSGELVLAKWDHFDFQAGVWNVPPEVRKMTKRRKRREGVDRVMLPPQAHAALAKLRALAPSSPWVLASPRGSESGHVSEKALRQALFDLQRKRLGPLGVEGGRPVLASPHKFRHTFKTAMLEKRMADYLVIELCLGHSKGDRVERTYNLATMDRERAQALCRWADYLDGLAGLGPEHVVSLDAARH